MNKQNQMLEEFPPSEENFSVFHKYYTKKENKTQKTIKKKKIFPQPLLVKKDLNVNKCNRT